MNNAIDLIIVDDHQIVIDGLRAMLLLNKSFKIIGTAQSATQLWELLQQKKPRVLLLDINLPEMSGIEIAKEILIHQQLDLYVLILTGNTERKYILEAVEVGVHGFLPKESPKEELIKAIQMVARGEYYFGQSIAPIVYEAFARQRSGKEIMTTPAVLTERELEVMKGFANGQTYKEIGADLFISPRTVETHKKNIFRKLQFENQADLIKYAIKNDIIQL